ncbi:hypothetical protein IW150_003562 [Coemansia sp. RSA 2607]|nr:hypothetical protein IW150_003562 [Coemansia sp. RSA 2607]
MAGITYEGAFSVPQRSNKVETTKLPKLSVSVNGVVCKSNVFPSLVRHLNQQHCIAEQDNEKDNSNSSNKRFLGVLNVTVPVEMLDTSSRTPWFVSTYESECIEAMIVDRLTSVFEDKTATLAPQQLVTRKTLPLLDWSRGKCGIDEPTSIHLPITQRSKRKATRLSADDTRSKSSRDKRVVKPKHMQMQALTDAISLADKVSERARIPQVKWSTHSGRLYEALASNSVSNVICVLRSDGSATTPEAMNSCTASTNAKPVAYLVTNPQDNIVALDIRNQPIPKNGAPCSIQLGPEMRPYAAIAQINQDGL